MNPRQRSSSALSNNSDLNSRQARTPSPANITRRFAKEPDDLVLNDVPNYGSHQSSSNLLIPSHGAGSPYPTIAGSTSSTTSAAAQRPRASTTDLHSAPATPYQPQLRMGDRSRIPLEYLQGQRSTPPNLELRQPYIPGPPPLSAVQPQSHVMNLPPPPPRPLAAPSQHGHVPPPPPGPPPSSSHGLSSGWGQQGQWGRSPGYIPPPPPPLGSNQGPGHQYGAHPGYLAQQPTPLKIPPPPPPQNQAQLQPHPQNEANLTSATYIPGGESFGPGVGIPPLYSYQAQQPIYVRDESFSYSNDQAHLLQNQRFYNGPSSAISPREEGSFADLPKPSTNRVPGSTDQNGKSQASQQVASSGAPDSSSHAGHGRTASNQSGLLSPNDPGLQWPLDKVLVWLAIQGFSNDWQETFRSLDIHGSDFLDLGRGNNGRGNFGMMHNLIYPRLARECGKSGSGWNQDRERNEGRRMRRLVRKIVEGTEGAPGTGHHRRESASAVPSASSEGNVENSPNTAVHEGFSNTPSTAGVGDDSPGRHFRSPIPTANGRTASKTRSSTAPIPSYGQAPSPANDHIFSEATPSSANRAGFSRGMLNNINDAAIRRHSPSASSEAGTGTPVTTLLGDAIRHGFDASPQSGSPATQHAMLSAASSGGALSAPPPGRLGHQKSGSTDSTNEHYRRNGQEGTRPYTVDSASKAMLPEPPTSAKELSKGFLDRFRKRKKDESSHASPEESRLESPTSPVSYRQMPNNSQVGRHAVNGSTTSLERPSSASTQMSEHERLRERERSHTKPTVARRYVLVTPDQWNYRLVDITDADTPDLLRESICKFLNYPEHDMAQIHLTEPGQIEHDEPLSDAFLMMFKHTKADNHGSLKLFVRRGPTSASLAPPPSAGWASGLSPKASPPAGSLFPRKALDEEGYARVRSNARTRSKSPPANSQTDAESKTITEDLNGGSTRGRIQSMKSARESGTLSDEDYGAYLEAALEEHRQEMERQGKGFPPRRQSRFGSLSLQNGGSAGGTRREDPLVPMRKPPAPPPGSVMLEKANSLSRRTGESIRSSVASQAELLKRRSGGDPIIEELDDRNRHSAAGGVGAALAGTGDVSSAVGKPVGSRRNLPFRELNEQASTSRDGKPSLALQTSNVKNPSIENMRRKPSPSISPTSQSSLSRKTSVMSRPKSYGPNFAFKETDVKFDPMPQPKEESDEDSDDGLFAKPLAKNAASKGSKSQSQSKEEQTQQKPTLKLDTEDQRRMKGRSVTFKTPETSTTLSTARSTETPDFNDNGYGFDRPLDEKQAVDGNDTFSRPPQSPDTMAAKIARRQSFARDDVWANRPPAEDLLDNLDAFFPNLDLDQPVVEDLAGSPPASPNTGDSSRPPVPSIPDESDIHARMIRTSLYDRVRPESIAEEPETLGSEESTLKSRAPISTAPSIARRSMRKSGGLGRMKSIRDVARGAYDVSSKRNTQVATTSKSGDILRRKSTKMFGANIVQIKPGRGSRVSLIESVPKDLPPGTNSFQIGRGQLIGKGSYGRVYLGINLTTGDFLAVKQVEVNQRGAGQDKEKMREMVAALDQEIDTMQHLEHPNIVQYLGCERKEFSISIFLEYISGGSIGSCLRKHGKFEESLVSSLTRQTLCGLAYLHESGVLHRDLKADNILLTVDGICKISDFGISKKTDNIYGNDITNSMQGSVFWMAPEVVRSQGMGYSAKVDIWSLGCVVLEMFAGRRPWSKEEAIGAIYKLGSNQPPPIPDDVSGTISVAALAFMLDCFTIDPHERPIAETLLREHPFCKINNSFNFLDTDLHRKLEAAKASVKYDGQK